MQLRFARFESKIFYAPLNCPGYEKAIHQLRVDKSNNVTQRPQIYGPENEQSRCIFEKLRKHNFSSTLTDSDLIIMTDLDEVPASWAMQGLSECEIKPGVAANPMTFEMDMVHYNLRAGCVPSDWRQGCVVPYKRVKDPGKFLKFRAFKGGTELNGMLGCK